MFPGRSGKLSTALLSGLLLGAAAQAQDAASSGEALYAAGACSTCHGPVDRMPLMWQAASLQMEWCLECHRQPERYLRPRDQVFNMNWQPAAGQETLGRELMRQYNVRSPALLTSCSTCHR